MSITKKPKIQRGKNKHKEERKPSGWYEYKNHRIHDLILPKPTVKGVTLIKSKETWQGDDYYFILVRNNLAQLVGKISESFEEYLKETTQKIVNNEVIVDSKDEVIVETKDETVNNETNVDSKDETVNNEVIVDSKNETVNENKILIEENKMSEKLLLDQPDCISNQGKVEHVVVNDDNVVVLNNIKQKKKVKKDKLTEQKHKETLITDISVDGIQILN